MCKKNTGRILVTPEIIDKCWEYHQTGVKDNTIADILNISPMSVLRAWKAMQNGSMGYKCSYNGMWASTKHIADYANEKFASVIEAREQREAALKAAKEALKNNNISNESKDDILIEAIKDLTTQVKRQNDLIENIIKKFETKV